MRWTTHALFISASSIHLTIFLPDSWNDESVAAAWDEANPSRQYAVYAASKTEAEKTAWKWVETHKPGFVLNTVLPNFNVSHQY
jgi:nucleoside-diphosphate-sugar epimerase